MLDILRRASALVQLVVNKRGIFAAFLSRVSPGRKILLSASAAFSAPRPRRCRAGFLGAAETLSETPKTSYLSGITIPH